MSRRLQLLLQTPVFTYFPHSSFFLFRVVHGLGDSSEVDPVLLDHMLEIFLAFHKVMIVVLAESEPRVLLLALDRSVEFGLAWTWWGGGCCGLLGRGGGWPCCG